MKSLHDVKAYWLEKPFANMALDSYAQLAISKPKVALAAGEGCHNYLQAEAMINHAKLSFIQIDTGRIGGITPAKRVADLAIAKGVSYVNHTFTSHLALSASLQPYVGIEKDFICEYPVESKQLSMDITSDKIEIDNNGQITVPEKNGLGLQVDIEVLRSYQVEVEINLNGQQFYHSPQF